MKHYLILPLALIILISNIFGCAQDPRLSRMLNGKGFYSDSFTEQQVQDARTKGLLTSKGHFYFETFQCIGLTSDSIYSNLIQHNMSGKLKELDANAIINVGYSADSNPFLQMIMLPVTLPTFPFNCNLFALSGDAVYVNAPGTTPDFSANNTLSCRERCNEETSPCYENCSNDYVKKGIVLTNEQTISRETDSYNCRNSCGKNYNLCVSKCL